MKWGVNYDVTNEINWGEDFEDITEIKEGVDFNAMQINLLSCRYLTSSMI